MYKKNKALWRYMFQSLHARHKTAVVTALFHYLCDSGLLSDNDESETQLLSRYHVDLNDEEKHELLWRLVKKHTNELTVSSFLRCFLSSNIPLPKRAGYLRAMLWAMKEGRHFHQFCTLENLQRLRKMLVLFSRDLWEAEAIPSRNSHWIVLDLAFEFIPKWTLLDVLVDIDTEDAAFIFLEIVSASGLQQGETSICIQSLNDSSPIFCSSARPVPQALLLKVANRSSLAGREELNRWGREFLQLNAAASVATMACLPGGGNTQHQVAVNVPSVAALPSNRPTVALRNVATNSAPRRRVNDQSSSNGKIDFEYRQGEDIRTMESPRKLELLLQICNDVKTNERYRYKNLTSGAKTIYKRALKVQRCLQRCCSGSQQRFLEVNETFAPSNYACPFGPQSRCSARNAARRNSNDS